MFRGSRYAGSPIDSPLDGAGTRALAGRISGSELGREPADSSPQPQSEVWEIIAGLQDKLANNPEDADGWSLLARSFMVTERYRDASPAYARALSGAGQSSADGCARRSVGACRRRPCNLPPSRTFVWFMRKSRWSPVPAIFSVWPGVRLLMRQAHWIGGLHERTHRPARHGKPYWPRELTRSVSKPVLTSRLSGRGTESQSGAWAGNGDAGAE